MAFFDFIGGTHSDKFHVGKNGFNVKNSGGVCQIRNAADTGFATLQALNSNVSSSKEHLPARLSLTSGTPVTTSDVTAAGTLYLNQYGQGNQIGLWSGTEWYAITLSSPISLVLSVTSGSNYDVFIYDNAGALTLELSAAWASNTSRTDALGTQDGIDVKNADKTRRWLGTIRASGTNTCEDSKLKRFCWNAYNQVERELSVLEPTNSWTTSNTAFESLNASTANRVEFVQGNNAKPVSLDCIATVSANADAGCVGIGLDSTTVNSASIRGFFGAGSAVAVTGIAIAKYKAHIALGSHYLQLLQAASSGTPTFYGDAGTSIVQSGAVGKVWG